MLRSAFSVAAVVALAAVIAGPMMDSSIKSRLLHLRLSKYYEAHAPSQLSKVDGLVERYVHDEGPLVVKLMEKYNTPLPEASPWDLNDPVGVGAWMGYTHARTHAAAVMDKFEERFPHVRGQLQAKIQEVQRIRDRVASAISKPAQLLVASAFYVLASCRVLGVSRVGLLVAVAVTVMLFTQPGVGDVSPESLSAGMDELTELAQSTWEAFDLPRRAAASTAVALVLVLTALRGQLTFVLAAWLLVLLAISKPGLEPGTSTLDAIGSLGVADTNAVNLFRHSGEDLFAVHDMSFYSVITLSGTSAKEISEWSAPMLAVGVADRWLLLSNIQASMKDEMRVNIELPGLALPLYFGPLLASLLLFIHALISGLA